MICCRNGSTPIANIVINAPSPTTDGLRVFQRRSTEPHGPRLASSRILKYINFRGRQNHCHFSWLIHEATEASIAAFEIVASREMRAFRVIPDGSVGAGLEWHTRRIPTIAPMHNMLSIILMISHVHKPYIWPEESSSDAYRVFAGFGLPWGSRKGSAVPADCMSLSRLSTSTRALVLAGRA